MDVIQINKDISIFNTDNALNTNLDNFIFQDLHFKYNLHSNGGFIYHTHTGGGYGGFNYTTFNTYTHFLICTRCKS